jgi:predicted N-acetyltransferase YhbS
MKSPEVQIYPGSVIPEIAWSQGVPDIASISPEGEAPDARVIVIGQDGTGVAHAALWWNQTPEFEGERVGAIGGFVAMDAAVTEILLKGAVGHLRSVGYRRMVGPMNGNTWRNYRFVIESTGRGPFLLEPRNPADYPDWWRAAGFSEFSRYSSSAISLDGEPTVPPALKQRLLRSGVVIRPLDPARYDEELSAIHDVCLRSFASNFLYTPLEKEPFLDAYRRVKARVDPDFVRVAERDGIACGFVFAIADFEAAARGEKPALIIKTLAVDPESRCAGLGSLLVDEVQMAGYAKGFDTAIHALQYDGNTVLRITARHHGEVIRRYALFTCDP